MATKCKPQGPRCKKFEIWTKMAKVPKPQGPKWQFTQLIKKKWHWAAIRTQEKKRRN
ncbi:hypothetical protein HanOQP8_Chr16g0629861 [Helianthus annuus]|nr:hypothetical protein HanOQP8_Chr16g0629861 [Helianthus annuus]